MQREAIIKLIFPLFFTILIAIIGWNTGLFWDNILFVHKMSIPLLENGVWAWGSLPLQNDPGHPPFIATYMSIMWNIFGRSIYVAHIALYPFIALFIYEILHIAITVFKSTAWGIFTTILVLADSTIFSSLMYIGTEVFVLSFSAIAIRGITTNNPMRKTIGLMLLGITSLRGMMLCAGLFLWDFSSTLFLRHNGRKCLFLKQFLYPYIIAAIPALSFVVWRLISKGWIISNPIAPWGDATGFENIVDFMTNFLRNALVFIQRITDFGRFFICCIVMIYLWQHRIQLKSNSRLIIMLLFLLCSCCIIIPVSLCIKNPMGHSYFLLIYIGMSFLFVELLKTIKWRKIAYILVISILLLGNLIVYPETISQGWAASLASLPYWKLRQQVLTYIDNQNIPYEEVFFDFPFGSCSDDVDLNGDKRAYAKDLNKATYFVASNVCNFNDETLKNIKTYSPIFHTEKRGVYITLYRIR